LNKEQSVLLNAIDIKIRKAISELEFNKNLYGKVIASLGNNLYTVQINGENYDIKSEGQSISIGEVVTITVPNNNFSKKYIRSGYTSPVTLPTTWEKINEFKLTSNVSQVDFNNIDTSYKSFKIIYVGAGSGGTSALYITVNNITSGYANYNYFANSSTLTTTVTTSFAIPSAVNNIALSEITLSSNASNVFLIAHSLSNIQYPLQSAGKVANSSAISKISLFTGSGGSLISGSKITLLGLK
jgi:hypothetical protein